MPRRKRRNQSPTATRLVRRSIARSATRRKRVTSRRPPKIAPKLQALASWLGGRVERLARKVVAVMDAHTTAPRGMPVRTPERALQAWEELPVPSAGVRHAAVTLGRSSHTVTAGFVAI